jgi:hypothetical protein
MNNEIFLMGEPSTISIDVVATLSPTLRAIHKDGVYSGTPVPEFKVFNRVVAIRPQ